MNELTLKESFNYFSTIDLDKFVNAAATATILSIVATVVSDGRLTKVIGRTPFSILYLLRSNPITLSM